jgi:hypothetical protein
MFQIYLKKESDRKCLISSKKETYIYRDIDTMDI